MVPAGGGAGPRRAASSSARGLRPSRSSARLHAGAEHMAGDVSGAPRPGGGGRARACAGRAAAGQPRGAPPAAGLRAGDSPAPAPLRRLPPGWEGRGAARASPARSAGAAPGSPRAPWVGGVPWAWLLPLGGVPVKPPFSPQKD